MITKRQIAIAAGIVIGLVWLAMAASKLVLAVADAFFLTVLGIVFAVFLHRCSVWLSERTPLSRNMALTGLTVLLPLASGACLWFFGQQLVEKVAEGRKQVDQARRDIRQTLDEHPTLDSLVARIPMADEMLSPGGLGQRQEESRSQQAAPTQNESASQTEDQQGAAEPDKKDSSETNEDAASAEDSKDAEKEQGKKSDAPEEEQSSSVSFGKVLDFLLKAFQSTMGLIANLAVIFFVGVYLAADPALYRDGVVRLFPMEARDRTREILNDTGKTLWKWLIGRLLCMAVVGVGSGIVLALLKVPLAPWLALLAAGLAFIPNVGPAVSLAITTLVALPQGLSTAGWVVVAYFGIELFESYLLTPLVQHKMVEIPPALLIVVQLVFGLLAGFLGLTVATPLLAAGMVIVKRAYLEDVLGEADADGQPDRGMARAE